MSLFSVPGWTAPPQLTLSSNPGGKKRKRSAVAEEDGKVQEATRNLEKLMKKLDTGGDTVNKQKKSNKKKDESKPDKFHKVRDQASQPKSQKDRQKESVIQSHKKKLDHKRNEQAKKPHKPNEDAPKQAKVKASDESGLTPLQSSMKSSLEGARFRHFNELLYKSTSEDAQKLVHQDPSVIDDYHAGFRHQVQSWPVNPVNQFIAELASMKQPVVIADLGCGDAAIARQLVPKGTCVLSFDLKSDNRYVVEADICQRIPLPGSETEESDGGQVVDVVVCALSLMSTNWMGCIREVWRILKSGGSLKIAEVTSRFEDVEAFVELVKGAGFKLLSKDESNTHFVKFDFVKVSRTGRKPIDWKQLERKGKLLKPCEYKRR